MYVCKTFPLAGSSSGSGFPLLFHSRRKGAEGKNSLSFSFHSFFFHKKKKRKGKPSLHFFFSSLSFREVEEMALFLTFSSISSLSFQKKRRRKGVGEEVFSLSFLFLSLFFFRRKRREEELLIPSIFLPF